MLTFAPVSNESTKIMVEIEQELLKEGVKWVAAVSAVRQEALLWQERIIYRTEFLTVA